MEEENNKRETRRSRSKTPLTLRSSVDRDVEVDGEKKKVKKNPTVEYELNFCERKNLSQHRREIKPGVIAMPNMSRRSLEHHQTRVNDSYYDSQDETDISFGLNGGRSYTESRSFFSRLITVITTFFSSTYYRVTSIFRREQPPSIYYAHFAEPKKGIIRRSLDSITNAVLAVLRYIHLGILTVLYSASRALQSTSQGKKKGFLIGLLVLLPLLLLGGAYYYLDKPAPIPTLSFDDLPLIDYEKTASVENYNKVVNISSGYWMFLKADHPVVHVSWIDANAFCEWKEKCLYPWGYKLNPGDKHRLKIWQGEFPDVNTADDGYLSTCPVHRFKQNDFDLYNMVGNVWE